MSSIVFNKQSLSKSSSWLRAVTYAVMLLCGVSSVSVPASDNLQAKEYLVKSAFLYNFARLSEWPDNTFKKTSDPFKLCIMGDDSFGLTLNSIRDKKINGHPLLIFRRVTLESAAHCQLVFVSRSEEQNLSKIISYLQQYPVLTISELPDFAQQNGHIRLFLNNENTLSLEINLQAIRDAHLNISSRILTLATIVRTNVKTDKSKAGGN